MITDTHAHLNDEMFDDDLKDVINRAKVQGVSRIIVIGMDNETSKKAIAIASAHEGLHATAGIHPGYVDSDQDMGGIKDLIKTHQVVGVGETGLDLHWRKDNLDLQKEVFLAQIKLSIEFDLPLVIHTRSSFEEAYQMLLPFKGKVKGVFHCFSSTLEDAKRAVDLGFYIGIDGPVTYKKSDVIRSIVEDIPMDRLLVETDSPYLAPQAYRGKRNEPSYLVDVIDVIAKIKGMTTEAIARITTQNADTLFRLGGKDR
ncbi:MAG: TatD family hydrolase [Acholeplasmataceae bacterium]|nr:TatD family hydrolase [Acholeplasmataceae bacterium]